MLPFWRNFHDAIKEKQEAHAGYLAMHNQLHHLLKLLNKTIDV